MKAWRLNAYNEDVPKAIESMTLEDVPVPAPKDGEVQIKVDTASINPIDWKLFSGGYHGLFPVTFPYTPGFDVAGTVSAVGPNTTLKVGDRVIVDTGLAESCNAAAKVEPGGAFAEFVLAPEGLVVKIGDLPFEKVAGLPLAGMTSYQALFTGNGTDFTGKALGSLAAGQKLLVLGGASMTGQFAIQLGKDAGATVATTASSNPMPDGTPKVDAMKALGADVVVNYKSEDWSAVLAGKEYDLIYDCVGDAEDWKKAAKVLKKGGKFVTIANFGENAPIDGLEIQAFIIKSNSADLAILVEKVKAGKLKVGIDSTVPLADVKAALIKSVGWSAAGKQLVKI